ncbi:MAG: adenylate/guanylate cyclase domain-containing protein [Sideroxyarcus sp.]|nr:adenylate/guanylate cyclase domain-containing protein [Sideroxyarcus sp.]
MKEQQNHDIAAPNQDDIQAILHKVIIAHQQALTLLEQTEAAYSRLVPHQLLSLLQARSIVDIKLGDQVERKMTIMFSDIRDFTPLSESMTPAENFEFINSYLSLMEPVISRHHGIIDKFIGDAIMALFEKGADEALNGAIDMLEKLAYYNTGRQRAGYPPIQIGIGLNSGMVMIGTVGGINRMDSTVIGDAVNLAARLEEATKIYDIPLIISHNTLYDLDTPAAYHFRFLDRIRVKGKAQPLSIYEVFDNDAPRLRQQKTKTREDFEQAVAHYHLKDIALALPRFERCVTLCPDDIPARIYLERCREYQATQRHFGTGELDLPLLWKVEFETGIERVDAAHQALLQRINQHATRIRQNEPTDFDDLFLFVQQHCDYLFPFEEALMRKHLYPFVDSHTHEHQHFIANYRNLLKQFRSGCHDQRYLAYRIELLLLDWFASHANKADRHFARYMQNTISRQTATILGAK